MRVLLDESLPHDLRYSFPDHVAVTVTYMGWARKENGDLLDLAEASFDVLLTVDRGLPFQQNIAKRKIAVIVLVVRDNQLETLERLLPGVEAALERIKPEEVVHIGA